MNNRQQMELGLGGAQSLRPMVRRQRRLTRARWWFDQMHMVVDRAETVTAVTTRTGQMNQALGRHD